MLPPSPLQYTLSSSTATLHWLLGPEDKGIWSYEICGTNHTTQHHTQRNLTLQQDCCQNLKSCATALFSIILRGPIIKLHKVHPSLTPALSKRWSVSFMHQPIYASGRSPHFPLNMWLDGPKNQSGSFRRKRMAMNQITFPSLSSQQPGHHTNYTILHPLAFDTAL